MSDTLLETPRTSSLLLQLATAGGEYSISSCESDASRIANLARTLERESAAKDEKIALLQRRIVELEDACEIFVSVSP